MVNSTKLFIFVHSLPVPYVHAPKFAFLIMLFRLYSTECFQLCNEVMKLVVIFGLGVSSVFSSNET